MHNDTFVGSCTLSEWKGSRRSYQQRPLTLSRSRSLFAREDMLWENDGCIDRYSLCVLSSAARNCFRSFFSNVLCMLGAGATFGHGHCLRSEQGRAGQGRGIRKRCLWTHHCSNTKDKRTRNSLI